MKIDQKIVVRNLLIVFLLLKALNINAQEDSKIAINGYKGNYIYNVFNPASPTHPDGEVVGFRLDRKEQKETNWQTLYKCSTPSNFGELSANFEAAKKKVFDYNPLIAYSPSEVWPVFKKTFNFDSIAPYVTQQTIAIAFNVLLVDTTAKKELVYQYKLVQLKKDGTEALSYSSDPVSDKDFVVANKPKKSGRKVIGNGFRMEWKAKANGKLPGALIIKRSDGINMPFNQIQADYDIAQRGDSIIYTIDDDQIKKEELYQYTITPVNIFGGGAKMVSDTLQATVLEQQMLKPKFFTAAADTLKNQIILNWSFMKPDLVGAISVYRSIDYEGNYELIGSTTGYNYIDNTIVPGQKYYYYLVVTDVLAKTTERSVKVYGLTYKIQKSNRPANIAVANKAKQSVISWVDNNNDTRGFYVYRAKGTYGELKLISEFIYKDEKANGNYTFTDTATNLTGKIGYAVISENLSNVKSDFSTTVYVQHLINPPAMPTIIDFKNTGTGVYLFWQDAETPKTSTGYNIYRKKGTENYVKVNQLPVSSNKTTYLDNQVINDLSISYKITAINASGAESDFSNEVAINDAQVVYPPSSLKSFYSADGKRIMLQWQPSQSEVASYQVYRYVRGEEPVKINDAKAGTISFIDADFNKSQTNYYFIKTIGLNGKISLPSEETYKTIAKKK